MYIVAKLSLIMYITAFHLLNFFVCIAPMRDLKENPKMTKRSQSSKSKTRESLIVLIIVFGKLKAFLKSFLFKIMCFK